LTGRGPRVRMAVAMKLPSVTKTTQRLAPKFRAAAVFVSGLAARGKGAVPRMGKSARWRSCLRAVRSRLRPSAGTVDGLAAALAEGMAEFRRGLEGEAARMSPIFEACAREAAAGCPAVAENAGRMGFALAQSVRESFLIMETLMREMALFGLSPDRSMREMASALAASAGRLPRLLKGTSPSAARRRDLETFRREMAAARTVYEKNLGRLFRRWDAVEVLKEREMHRHLWRMAESLRRLLRPLEEEITSERKGAGA